MKITELRIGNLVQASWKKTTHQVSCHTFVEINEFDHCYNPIPLTEEWLERFGFEKMINPNGSPSWIYVKNGDAWIYETFKDHDFFIRSHFFSRMVRSICFVHTLQNLYFALTGEELTLKEEVKP